MQERRLRLGDVLDDYCPREKRLTNHVIVALVEDEIRQTRCTTCDTEHPFKHGRVPVRRKKADATSVLYKQVLDNVTSKGTSTTEADVAPRAAAPPVVVPPGVVAVPVPPAPAAAVVPPRVVEPAEVPAAAPLAAAPDETAVPREEPVHRHQLIRAQLPRIEGQVPERKPADFTLWHVSRHAQARGRRRDQRGAVDGNVGYSPFSNGHPKAPAKPSSRPPQGQSSRRKRRGR
jgi:hypothetical protein